jgi:hypothetical protein
VGSLRDDADDLAFVSGQVRPRFHREVVSATVKTWSAIRDSVAGVTITQASDPLLQRRRGSVHRRSYDGYVVVVPSDARLATGEEMALSFGVNLLGQKIERFFERRMSHFSAAITE